MCGVLDNMLGTEREVPYVILWPDRIPQVLTTWQNEYHTIELNEI